MTDSSPGERRRYNSDQRTSEGITRREALRGAAAGGALIVGGGLLSACGANPSVIAQSSPPPKGPIKAGGSLTIGSTGGGAQDSIDAHFATSDPDIARLNQLYEPLAVRDADFNLRMLVAESMRPEGKKPDKWIVRLRPGVTFHNGQPVTADDVIFSLNRIINPKNPGTGAASIGYIDLKNTKKLDRRTVRVVLQFPNVGFPDDVGQYFNGIVPVGYDPKHPVGTGPFKYQSFAPGQQSLFVRNSEYWDGPPHVEQVTIIDFVDDTAKVNALLSGQVHAITNLPAAQLAQVKGLPSLRDLISKAGAWQPFTMRVDKAPFDDVRVRQAFRLIVNRRQMIDQVLLGQGRLGNDLYAPLDPAYNTTLPQRHQDLEQAKFLLKQAGRSGLTVTLVTAPVFEGIVEAAQVFAAQAAGAGVTVKLNKTDTTTFFGPNYLKWPFSQDFWFTRNYIPQVGQGSLPKSPFNETHWADPTFQKLIRQAQGELDVSKRTELLHAAQAIEHERGGYIVWAFSNQLDAYSSQVGGFRPARSGLPLTNYGFGRVGFVA